jgi:hypothetical protein
MFYARLVSLVLVVGWVGTALGAPLPISNDVQRISPARCPVNTIPIVNAQGANGAGGPPVAVTSHAEIIAGLGSRQSYSFLSDADFCGNYGGVTSNSAPATEPIGGAPCVDGFLFKANTLYAEFVFPGNRLDAACVSGTCNINTMECDP